MRKLILFDIDGTLLTTNGAAGRAFHRALLEVYGTAGPIDSYSFNGKTDPQIARDLLRHDGLDDDAIDEGFPRLWPTYLSGLAAALEHPDHRTHTYVGVDALLTALEDRTDRAVVGLLTGNIERGAAMKLSSCGLDGRFALGAYGSDHEVRSRLPAIAVRRAHELSGHEFRGTDIVIVGDTPFDVTCGRSLGVRAVAVATGGHDAAVLRAAGAHDVLPDLGDTERALAALLDGE